MTTKLVKTIFFVFLIIIGFEQKILSCDCLLEQKPNNCHICIYGVWTNQCGVCQICINFLSACFDDDSLCTDPSKPYCDSGTCVECRTTNDCPSCKLCNNGNCVPDGCAGITPGTINTNRQWAHFKRLVPAESTTITLTAVGGTDPDWDGSSCSGNHIDLTKTEWEPSSGTCDPSTGASSNWKPSERGNFQVRAKFEDMTGSGECDEEGQWTSFMQIINAFEIKVSMQVIDNAEGGNGTVTKELWEYATGEQAVSWQSLPCSSNRIKWNNTLINIPPLRQEDEDNVHIDFVYTPVPENAVLSGGWIVAKLKTYSSATLICRVEDADAFEEPVTIDVGITVGNPVGFNIGTTFTFGSNCAEGSAVAAWGYNSTDGLGSSHSPGNYKLVKTSNQFIDEELFMCADLDGNALSLANLHLKVSESPVVYDTNWVLIKKSSNGTVQAEWTGYSCAEVGGIDWPFGKYSSSSLGEWNVWVGIKEVGYEE